MIVVPETPITEASFQKWKCHRMDITDEELDGLVDDIFMFFGLRIIAHTS